MKKNLKSIFSIAFSFLISVMILSACDSKKTSKDDIDDDSIDTEDVDDSYDKIRNRLADDIRITKSILPIDIQGLGQISDLTYNRHDNVVSMEIEILDSDVADGLDKGAVISKQTFQTMLSSSQARPMTKIIADADASLRLLITYRGKPFFDEIFSPDQVRQAADRDTSDKDLINESLQINAAQMKTQLPVKVDEITTMTDVDYDGSTYTYYYLVDESTGFDLSSLDNASIKDVLISQLQLNNAAKQFVRLLKENNTKIDYIYRGNRSNKKVVITINPDEVP